MQIEEGILIAGEFINALIAVEEAGSELHLIGGDQLDAVLVHIPDRYYTVGLRVSGPTCFINLRDNDEFTVKVLELDPTNLPVLADVIYNTLKLTEPEQYD